MMYEYSLAYTLVLNVMSLEQMANALLFFRTWRYHKQLKHLFINYNNPRQRK
jgi:hypothetical protein